MRAVRGLPEQGGDHVRELAPGGLYCSDTRTMVLPPAMGSKRAEPADLTLEPSVCHAISSFTLSLMIFASHSNLAPMGPLLVH
jgi:hypothetical protein